MNGEATRWAARRCAGPLSPEDARRFEAWLAADERHAGGLLRAEAALALVARARVLNPIEDGAKRVSRRRVIGWGAGASIAASTLGAWFVSTRNLLTTRVGEIRRTRLADASTVTLNTHSRVAVDLQPRERHLSLDHGEAWFQVAHDRSRPFVVSAGDVRVRAVGTAFSVRRMADGADVLVTEGRVEVWRTGDPAGRVSIASGSRAFVPDDDVPIVPMAARAEIGRALAWRTRHLALAGETLDFAIAEMNRYNDVQLRVDDPLLGRRPIIGYFDVGDPDGFARSVAAALDDAQVRFEARIIRITPSGA